MRYRGSSLIADSYIADSHIADFWKVSSPLTSRYILVHRDFLPYKSVILIFTRLTEANGRRHWMLKSITKRFKNAALIQVRLLYTNLCLVRQICVTYWRASVIRMRHLQVIKFQKVFLACIHFFLHGIA